MEPAASDPICYIFPVVFNLLAIVLGEIGGKKEFKKLNMQTLTERNKQNLVKQNAQTNHTN